jgi:hypothetical protein
MRRFPWLLSIVAATLTAASLAVLAAAVPAGASSSSLLVTAIA